MYIKNLPQVAVAELEEAFRKTRDGREKLKYHALWLLARGYKRAEVKNIIGRDKNTLGRWVTAYNQYGLSGLKNKPQPGNHRKLTKQQKDRIKEWLNTQTPKALGCDSRFWSIEFLQRLVKDKFGVTYQSRESYRKLLIYCGFSYHKVDKENRKRDPHLIKRFEDKLKKDSRGIREKMVWYW
jgi:putative transposase